MWIVVLFGLIAASWAMPPPRADPTCGYQACHPVSPDLINVHLVAHTHDDVGWLKTVDQYYYGARSDIQRAGVQYIIDSVLQELGKNPDRRFIYVETSFLWKWWEEQNEETRQKMKDFINSGQLEIIGGGWSMNDEAAAHYHSIVDQFSWGFRILNDTFGSCARPHIGWQIDPFGHSREMASLMSQFGFDGLFFGRLDYQDKSNRLNTKTAEMIWSGSGNLGASADLFTSVLYNTYFPPPGFCFDLLCNDEPLIDNPSSADYNVDRRVQEFTSFIEEMAVYYRTNNLLITMGGDFNYQDANTWFKNLDKLIRYVNEKQSTGGRINVLYSTPSCYLKALNDAGLAWPTKDDDFFPYASDPHAYWTGYFTSRPTSKYFERQGNNFLQVCKQMHVLSALGDSDEASVTTLRQVMGIMQHHDAITGTEKQHVAFDYARLLSDGFSACSTVVENALNKLAATSSQTPVTVKSCLLRNATVCDVSENSQKFVVTVYNPLSHTVSQYVRLPITGSSYIVQGPDGTEIAAQIVPIHPSVLNLGEKRNSTATNELVFRAADIPPLGFKSYFISQQSNAKLTTKSTLKADAVISNSKIQVILDTTTGLVKSVINNGVEVSVSQDFFYYKGAVGNNEEFNNRSSGAYIFRPQTSETFKISNNVTFQVYQGDIVEEIHQTFSNWVSQVIRLYKEENHVEFEWLVGPIPIVDITGKEIISRFTSNLQTDGTFYTDSNGRELLQRTRNFRPTWQLDLAEPVAGNYYPVTSKILIRDNVQNLELAVLNDRAQGGSSLADGEVELMVHRRLLHDDAFGVGEALNEAAFGTGLIARGQHYLVAGAISGSDGVSLAAQERELTQRKVLSPWLLLTPGLDYTQWSSSFLTQFSGLTADLPQNIQILTLEPWKDGKVLLRLEHTLELNEDPVLSQDVTVDLQALFSSLSVISAKETTLGGNQWIEESNRLTWTAERNSIHKKEEVHFPIEEKALNIVLSPMQIRTFILEISR